MGRKRRLLTMGKTLFMRMSSHKPISKTFGLDRGKPIDRYYIEKFLEANKQYIQGNTMEIAERDYSLKYGGDKVKNAYVLHVAEAKDDLSIKGNLETGENIPQGIVDCFILTQTLPFIYDMKAVIKNLIDTLKPGGYALITVPGITQISRYDMDRWGHYWNFTDLSIKRLLMEVVPEENIKIQTFGNVKVAASFLYGLSTEEMKKRDLEYNDPDYQVVITAVVKKPIK